MPALRIWNARGGVRVEPAQLAARRHKLERVPNYLGNGDITMLQEVCGGEGAAGELRYCCRLAHHFYSSFGPRLEAGGIAAAFLSPWFRCRFDSAVLELSCRGLACPRGIWISHGFTWSSGFGGPLRARSSPLAGIISPTGALHGLYWRETSTRSTRRWSVRRRAAVDYLGLEASVFDQCFPEFAEVVQQLLTRDDGVGRKLDTVSSIDRVWVNAPIALVLHGLGRRDCLLWLGAERPCGSWLSLVSSAGLPASLLAVLGFGRPEVSCHG